MTLLAAYIATETILELAIAVVIYRKRRILINMARRFILDAAGTPAVLSNLTTIKTMIEGLPQPVKKTADAYDESTLEFQRDAAEDAAKDDQVARYNAACAKARKDHKKLPNYADFS